jgi:glucose/arabinose dehydrogenase
MKAGPFFRVHLLAFLISLTIHAQLIREPNTTLNFPTTPTTAAGSYALVDAFPNLTFDRPVCIATPPGETNRLFVVERAGRVIVITNLANPTKTVFLDLTSRVNASDWINNRRTEGLSSIAFHPDFASNHRFFVSYNTVTNTAAGDGHHNRVSEIKANNDNSLGLPDTEIFYITQYDEGDGHNINDLHFGPDGYLYIASGDEGDGGTGDDFNNAQKIDKDFFSAIMRIDVDKKSGNLTPNTHDASNESAYKIPADNPFVGATSFNGIAVDAKKVRTEFYAVGLRNPWRFSFDPVTGKIYEGDVGQHGREEINEIVKGGNYGWSFKEASLNGPKFSQMPAGFTSIPPIFEYSPVANFASVTGGVVDRRANSPFFGHLIFADYQFGTVWTMNIDAQPAAAPSQLITGEKGIAAFGYDPRNSEVLLVNHDAGKIKRIQYNSGPSNLPQTLADTGIFSVVTNLQVNAGIYPYDVNVPLWSDGALKKRWFSIPAGKTITFNAEGNWTFPTGSIWVKQFDLESNPGNPASAVRVETRVLVKTDTGIYGLSYRWSDDQTTATLVGENGDTRGMFRGRQTWRFPSRADCLNCHTEASGRVLGFTTAQFNRDNTYGSINTNQIIALRDAKTPDNKPNSFFGSTNFTTHGLRALAALNDETVSRTFRVRSYLAANCAHCHQPGTGLFADWDGRITTPVSKANIIYGQLHNNTNAANKVVVPKDVAHSAMVFRMASTNSDRMPPIGVSICDTNAINLIKSWINDGFTSYSEWAASKFSGSTNAGPDDDFDGDGISNFTEYLMNSDPKSASSFATLDLADATHVTFQFPQPANRGYVIESSTTFPPSDWTLLDQPLNQITFPANPTTRTFTEPINSHSFQKTYRVRIIEP